MGTQDLGRVNMEYLEKTPRTDDKDKHDCDCHRKFKKGRIWLSMGHKGPALSLTRAGEMLNRSAGGTVSFKHGYI